MLGKQGGSWRHVWHGMAVLFVIVGLATMGGGAGAAAPAPALTQDTLVGGVTVAGGSVAAGAVVVALQDDTPRRTAVDASGNYTVTLGAGSWNVIVAAPPPTITSPT